MAEKLTEYLEDLGRVVAYYPNLKKITHTTTSAILLCQLFFLSKNDKMIGEDGWIERNSLELEEETGLTYHEQFTARRNLINLGILEELYKRIDHVMYFKINYDKMNELWGKATGKNNKSEKPLVADKIVLEKKEAKKSYSSQPTKPTKEQAPPKPSPVIALPEKRPLSQEPNQRVTNAKELIQKKLKVLVGTNQKWFKFINFALTREDKHPEESLSVFLDWALDNGFSPIYWTPEKMESLWPQAFVEIEEEEFVSELPEKTIKNVVPMPKDISRKKEIF